MQNVRVRFAPSPTGGLHLGGVRTALFNYLFAKKNGGKFIVRTEDTDQTRFVDGAEQYIFDCLKWCGIEPDESSIHGGEFGPYRQSERKHLYKQYAEKLIENGQAYYAFDTQEELEQAREIAKENGKTFQYDHSTRLTLKNSLTFTQQQTDEWIKTGKPYVVRIKIEPNQTIEFTDIIRGNISNDSNTVDDKVLLKADGMPTYHLAVVVDDYLMKITHAFRGEEWLPSAPIHVTLWKNLFGLNNMPKWAHLPLILKPDGNGKLSKRDGERLGFPVFALKWFDAQKNINSDGFKEIGFLPEAFVNFLALLGWNDGTNQEIFTLKELEEKFELERVNNSGAKFDFEKAKWFNGEWIKNSSAEKLLPLVKENFKAHSIESADEYIKEIIELVKERCSLITEFYDNSFYFFKHPESIDIDSIKPKWDDTKNKCFENIVDDLENLTEFKATEIEEIFKKNATSAGLKVGELQLPFRIMLVGQKMGPAVFIIAEKIKKEKTLQRIKTTLNLLK